jgi:transporter family-2 protein
MLGPAHAVLFIVICQVLVAYLIELFGLWGVEKQPFEWRKVIGIAISVVGLIIFKFK